jgi:hypothetical protein
MLIALSDSFLRWFHYNSFCGNFSSANFVLMVSADSFLGCFHSQIFSPNYQLLLAVS